MEAVNSLMERLLPIQSDHFDIEVFSAKLKVNLGYFSKGLLGYDFFYVGLDRVKFGYIWLKLVVLDYVWFGHG